MDGDRAEFPQRIVSAKLNATLRDDFYDGAGIGRVMLLPILTGCVLLIMLIWVSFSSRQELAAEWNQVWREIMGPHPARKVWRLLAESRGKAWLIRLLTDLRKEIDSAWMRRPIDTRSVGLTEANRPGIAAVSAVNSFLQGQPKTHDQPAYRAPIPPGSQLPSPANSSPSPAFSRRIRSLIHPRSGLRISPQGGASSSPEERAFAAPRSRRNPGMDPIGLTDPKTSPR
jgi:hypothetical protein